MRKILDIDLPIIQSPMAGVQDSELAIAVSSAGGLGSVPCGMLDLEGLQSELSRIRPYSEVQFNLNFFCHSEPAPNPEHESRWREILRPYFDEFDIDPNSISSGASRRPFSHETADILEAVKPSVVSFHFGLPAPGLLSRVKAWGSLILATATTIAEAKWLEENGVDAIIAQGIEAGGHRGMFLSKDISTQVGTFALVPQIVQQVDIPVIAAGGIADANGVRAALELGASAVQIGTAFLLCDEVKTSQLHRKAIMSRDSQHTVITNLFSGGPARGIVNRAIRELGPMNEHAPEYPLAAAAITALRRAAEVSDNGDFSPLWCGQNASKCREVSSVTVLQSLAEGLHDYREDKM